MQSLTQKIKVRSGVRSAPVGHMPGCTTCVCSVVIVSYEKTLKSK